jgi:hypothetical protein
MAKTHKKSNNTKKVYKKMNTPTNNSTRKSSRSAAPREFLTYSAKNTQDKIIKQGPDAKLSPKKNPAGGSASSPTKKAKSPVTVPPGAPQKPILTQEEKQQLREEKLPEEKMETEVTTEVTPTPEIATTTEVVTQETTQQDSHPTPQEEEEEEEEDWSQEQFMPFVDPDEIRERVQQEKEAATAAKANTTSTSSSSFSPLAEKLQKSLFTPVSGELNGQMQGITFQGEEESGEEESSGEEEEVQVTGQKNKFGFLTKEFYDPKNQGVIPHQKPNGKYYNKEGREVDQYGFHPIGLYHSWDGVSAHQKPDGKRYNKEGKRVNRLFQELDHEGKLVNSQEEDE